MRHGVKLLFGYYGYTGELAVSPGDMLILLREYFPMWLSQQTWDKYPELRMKETEFHLQTYESTCRYNNADFYFDPADARWLGFRIDLDQPDAECEFVFTTELITGEIRPDVNVISAGILDKLASVKSTLNEIVVNSRRKKS